MGLRRFDLPRRTRTDLILGLWLGALALAFIVNMLLSARASTIAPLIGGLLDLLLVLTLPVAWHFGIARRRRQLLCRAIIDTAERDYFLLDRLYGQAGAGQGDGRAAARALWLGEIDRFIDRHLGCLSKPGDIKIINECRADLVKAIDRLVVHEIEA